MSGGQVHRLEEPTCPQLGENIPGHPCTPCCIPSSRTLPRRRPYFIRCFILQIIFFPVFLAQVCLVANYTLHSHSLQSTFQRSPTCGKTDNRFKGTKYVKAGQQYKKLLSLVKTDPKCKKKTKSDGKPLISMPDECSPFDLYTF